MKKLFLLTFLVPLFSFAQPPCKLKKETDPFTHETKISTGFMKMEVEGLKLSFSIDATPSEVDFFIWITSDPKCFDDASTVVVNYEGDRLKGNFKNTGSMNCEGTFHFSFRNTTATPSALQKLTTKKISSLKLTGNNKTVTDINFTEEQKQWIMSMADCVVKEAKTLIKR